MSHLPCLATVPMYDTEKVTLRPVAVSPQSCVRDLAASQPICGCHSVPLHRFPRPVVK